MQGTAPCRSTLPSYLSVFVSQVSENNTAVKTKREERNTSEVLFNRSKRVNEGSCSDVPELEVAAAESEEYLIQIGGRVENARDGGRAQDTDSANARTLFRVNNLSNTEMLKKASIAIA